MSITEGPHLERTDTVVEATTPKASADEAHVETRGEVLAAPLIERQVHTTSGSRYAPDAVIAALVGLVLLVVGLIAVVRGGFTGPMSDPVVEVVGFTHTTTLGLIEIGLGLCLLISGAARSRSGAMFFGGLLGVAGFVGAVQTESFDTSLALESSMAWLAVVAGGVVLLTALVLPRFVHRSSTITQDSR